jgi:hypothetical protein
MASADSFSRGRYGAFPELRISAFQKRKFAIRVYIAVFMSKWCGFLSPPPRKVLTVAELAWIDKASNAVDFHIIRPLCAPRDYQISSLTEIAGSPNIATFVFQSKTGNEFTLEQRRTWLPLEEEVTLSRAPFLKTRVAGTDCYVIHGFYGGEPIDHAYWFNLRSIVFEISEIVLELREKPREGPGLFKLLQLVRFLTSQNT